MLYDKGPLVVLFMFTIMGIALFREHDIPKWLPILMWCIPIAVYLERAARYVK